MNNTLKKYRLTFIAFLILGIMILTAVFGIAPMYKKVLVLRDDIQKEMAKKENQEKQIKRLPELKTQYENVIKEEGHLDILLTEERVVPFIQTIEGLAIVTGTEIKIQSNDAKIEEPVKKKIVSDNKGDSEDVSQSETKKEKTLGNSLPYDNYLRLTLTVKGDYSELVDFLAKLETLPVALDVLGMDIHQPLREDDTTEGDVRSVNSSPFTQTVEAASDTLVAETGDNQSTNETSQTQEVAPEVIKPLSPKLEAVFDVAVYTAKQ